MDALRFATVSRSLAAACARRGALVALLGGTLRLLGLAGTEAKKHGNGKKKKKTCPPCKQRQQGKCTANVPDGTACTLPAGGAGACQTGTCVVSCSEGTTNCDGVCRNLQTDNTNCGACGVVCGATRVCLRGSCFPISTCPATTTIACLDPLNGTNEVRCGLAGGPTCFCSRSTEGNFVCIGLAGPFDICPNFIPCTSSTTCGTGRVCVETGSCCSGHLPAFACLAPCPTPAI